METTTPVDSSDAAWQSEMSAESYHSVVLTPHYSGNYPLVSCNQYGCTTSASASLTVLPAPFVGATLTGLR